ncbi:MAG: MBL fold metallo-hydrolase [candidate division Zixibacteria bacterium]|nr:MBL fold metallo-hydrolase [candidate division Zixibacteria bacterium]
MEHHSCCGGYFTIVIKSGKNMKRITVFFIITALLYTVPAIAQGLKIHCINVGQGDATLIESPSGKRMLVDNGPYYNVNELTSYLNGLGVNHIDWMVITHYHADHIGGTNTLFQQGYDIDAVYDRGSEYCGTTYDVYYEPVVYGLRNTAEDGDVFDFGDGVTARVVSVNGNGILYPEFIDHECDSNRPNNENDFSVAMVINYGEFDFFVGGDLSGRNTSTYTDIETTVANEVGDLEVYRVNHHGSYASSNQFFLTVTDPEVSVISCGDNNYGHPHEETLDRLRATSVIYQTADENGVPVDNDIVIISDGSPCYTVNDDPYLIYNANETPIADIQNNFREYEGRMVKISGIVTYSEPLWDTLSSNIYIQDSSGAGMNVYVDSLVADFEAYNEISVMGIVSDDRGVTRISPVSYDSLISVDNELPDGFQLSTNEINNPQYEGTRLFTNGTVVNIEELRIGTSITVDDGSGPCTGLKSIFNELDVSWVEVGDEIFLEGALNIIAGDYDTAYAVLLGTGDDIGIYTGIEGEAGGTMPQLIALYPNYPNPFNNSTTISFALNSTDAGMNGQHVRIDIYNIFGQHVDTPLNEFMPIGTYNIVYEMDEMPSGVYFYRLQAGDKSATRKMILLK